MTDMGHRTFFGEKSPGFVITYPAIYYYDFIISYPVI